MTTNRTQITAAVERVVFPKPDTDTAPASPDGTALPGRTPRFFILKCDVGTVKGRLDHTPKPGESLVLDGAWEVSRFNGRPEFSFFHAAVRVPTDERALLRYACEMTSGFGPALEEKIWNALGADWRNLSAEFPGVTPARLSAFRATLDFITNNAQRTAAVSRLVSIGLTVRMAEAAWEKWGASTLVRLDADPYILTALPGYGFRDADTHVRRHYEIADADPRRVNAAVSYFLRQLTEENTVATWPDLCAKTATALSLSDETIADAVRAMFSSRRLVPFPASQSLAAACAYEAEAGIFRFASLPESPASPDDPALPGRTKARQPRARDFDLSAEQMAAVQFALDSRFAIINGGAGTGKTSLVRALCDSLERRTAAAPVLLCSFAGKAAARLREATGHAASTVHSMLGWRGDAVGFTVKSLAGKTVILDEASMVASDLLYEIIRRAPARLVLVGDEAQLPPVGAGQPFHDLIAALPGRVRTLSVCYRNREAVFAAALAVRAGCIPPPSAVSADEIYEFTSRPNPRDAHAVILAAVRSGDIDFATDILLCCRNGDSPSDPCTVASLNADIKALVNPAPDGKAAITPGDRVICTRNAPDLDVWNGTTGRCDAFDSARAMWVVLDVPTADGRRSVLIPREKVKEWTLAYALTVHKAQGSQYRRVFFAVTPRDAAVLLDRPMVYTALTRARQTCRIIGCPAAFARAVAATRRKRTVIQELARTSTVSTGSVTP